MKATIVGPKPWPGPRALVALCILAGLVACQPDSTEADGPAEPADIPFGDGRLWQIEKEGFEPSYVFATIDSVDPILCDLPAPVRQAFNASPRAAFELIPTPEGEALVAEAIKLPPHRTLEEILGPELFQKAAAIVSEFGVGESALKERKPWLLAEMLRLSPDEVARLSQGVRSLDIWLQQRARQQGKLLASLGEAEELLDFWEEISERDQVSLVRDMVADFPQIESRAERVTAAYLKGDLGRLLVDMHDVSRSSDVEAAIRFRQQVVENRSHKVIERMLPLLNSGTTFFSLNAVLLPGEAGILRLLEERGYRVTRVH